MNRNKLKKDEMDVDEMNVVLSQVNSEKKKIERKRRYRSFDSKKPRERSVCTKCGSLDVKKRRATLDYKCGRCGCISESVGKIEW